jgi:Domain of unknown function (DUF3127)
MSLELTGTLIKVMPEVNGSGKNGNWVKQEFVIETFDQYPKKICCSAWGERVNDLKRYALGDALKLNISIESREYNERWYSDIRAYRIDSHDSQGESAPSGTSNSSRPAPAAPPSVSNLPSFNAEEEDLPF